MNAHINARTTYKSRVLILERYHEGWSKTKIAKAIGISRQSVHKWIKRFEAEGEAGLQNRSSRPMRSPNKLAEGCLTAILQLRKIHLMPAHQIASCLKLAYSTVCRYLQIYKLSRVRDIIPKEPARRYERANPGEIIHIDIKKLGKFEQPGHRVTGDRKGQSNPRSRAKGGYGWEYLHIAIDDHSRLAYAEILPDEKGETSLKFAYNTKAFFEKHGIKIERIMTDNGVGYKKTYARMLKAWGIKHITTRPYTPKTNGKAERFIQTCLNEWVYAMPYNNDRQRTERLQPFLDFYNHKRYHNSIKATPISRV